MVPLPAKTLVWLRAAGDECSAKLDAAAASPCLVYCRVLLAALKMWGNCVIFFLSLSSLSFSLSLSVFLFPYAKL